MNEKQSEVTLPERLTALAIDIDFLNKEIEKAIDNNLIQTQKRLDKERSLKISQFNKHAKEEFEILANAFKTDLEVEFDINITTQLAEIKRLKKLKKKAVQKQEYEKAAIHRDDELNEIMSITEILDDVPLTRFIDLTPDSVFRNFSKLIFLKTYTTYYIPQSDFSDYKKQSIELFKLNILHEHAIIKEYDYYFRSGSVIKEVKSIIQKIEIHKRLFALIKDR